MKTDKVKVRLYDLNETLIEEVGRLEYFKKRNIDWVERIWGRKDKRSTHIYANGVKEGMLCNQIKVRALDGVKEAFETNKKQGIESWIYTAAREDVLKIVLKKVGIKADGYFLTYRFGNGKKKTLNGFLKIYTLLSRLDKELISYCDDGEDKVEVMLKASRVLQKKFGKRVSVYLVNSAANALGLSDKGFIVIRNISEIDSPKTFLDKKVYKPTSIR